MPQQREQLTLRIKLPSSIQPNFVPPAGKAGVYTNKIHHFRLYLLEELPHHDFSLPFMEPVDTKLLKVPSYYAVIENPMDMGTIIKRVTHNYYHNVNELVYDVRLVISNCFKFNMPGSLVYRNGQELEELFMEVYDRMPQGAEVPLSKEVAEKSLMKHQCRCRLRKVREETDELEQDAQELFAEKWLPMVEALNNENLKTLEDFDARLHNILKYCKEHNKRIQGTYDYESSQIREEKGYKGAHNAYDELYDSLRECRMPPFDWEDGLIDTLNDTIKSLQKNLTNSRRRVKQKEKLGYCERLLPILINAQIISEGLCSQTYMPDSSEEDEPTSDPNTIDPIERELIRKQFSELDTEAKYDIMHIIEQSELSDERAYFLPKFSQKTMLLVKKAIKGYQMHLNTEVLALYDSESQANACEGFTLPPVPKPLCNVSEDYENMSDMSNNSDTLGNTYRYSDSSSE